MNVVDTSGWLEYFSGGPNAEYFLSPLNDPSSDFENLPKVNFVTKKSAVQPGH